MTDLRRGQRDLGESRAQIDRPAEQHYQAADRAYRTSNRWIDAWNQLVVLLSAESSVPGALMDALLDGRLDELVAERANARRHTQVARQMLRACAEVERVCSERIREIGEQTAAAHAAEVAARRAERLASRQPPPPSESPRPRCARCNVKPRSVDDYCKRCARDLGLVVHGKIGEYGQHANRRKRRNR